MAQVVCYDGVRRYVMALHPTRVQQQTSGMALDREAIQAGAGALPNRPAISTAAPLQNLTAQEQEMMQRIINRLQGRTQAARRSFGGVRPGLTKTPSGEQQLRGAGLLLKSLGG